MTKFISMLAAGFVFTSSAMAAHIRANDVSHDQYRANYLGDTSMGGIDRRACVKACEEDLNPCDPAAFKRADGRCSLQ